MRWFFEGEIDLRISWQRVRILRAISGMLLPGTQVALLVGVVASTLLVPRVLGQSASSTGNSARSDLAAPPQVSPGAPRKVSPYRSAAYSTSARNIYQFQWGADSFTVKLVESGQMIRFSYRVTDAEKAKQLNDKKAEPFLLDERARVKLVVPMMEKIGQLRQSSAPETGKVYWMVFSNKGGYVKRGDRVSVVIGKFRADELVVD